MTQATLWMDAASPALASVARLPRGLRYLCTDPWSGVGKGLSFDATRIQEVLFSPDSVVPTKARSASARAVAGPLEEKARESLRVTHARIDQHRVLLPEPVDKLHLPPMPVGSRPQFSALLSILLRIREFVRVGKEVGGTLGELCQQADSETCRRGVRGTDTMAQVSYPAVN